MSPYPDDHPSRRALRLKAPRSSGSLRRFMVWRAVSGFFKRHHRTLSVLIMVALILANVVMAVRYAVEGDLHAASVHSATAVAATAFAFIFDYP